MTDKLIAEVGDLVLPHRHGVSVFSNGEHILHSPSGVLRSQWPYPPQTDLSGVFQPALTSVQDAVSERWISSDGTRVVRTAGVDGERIGLETDDSLLTVCEVDGMHIDVHALRTGFVVVAIDPPEIVAAYWVDGSGVVPLDDSLLVDSVPLGYDRVSGVVWFRNWNGDVSVSGTGIETLPQSLPKGFYWIDVNESGSSFIMDDGSVHWFGGDRDAAFQASLHEVGWKPGGRVARQICSGGGVVAVETSAAKTGRRQWFVREVDGSV